MRTRVKICGLTRTEDARIAVEYGADAIGLVFFEGSPRHVTRQQAGAITAAVAPFVTVVGLFVDASPSRIGSVLDKVPLGLLQFHGHEANENCKRYGLPFIKSVPMTPGTDLRSWIREYPDARGLLLDAWLPRAHGGGGEPFDWSWVPRNLPVPVILAGGLTPANVAEAIRQVRPYAVDVSSGVESAKGIKSTEKLSAFINGVRVSDTDD
jgi:phosphoribosylanthranilate isomerase